MTKTLSAAALAATFAFAAPALAPALAQDSPDALAEAFCAAVIAEDAAALGALYTEDAVSYGPGGGPAAMGPEAIAASWGPFFDGFDNPTCTLERAGEVKEKKSHTAWGLWSMTATPAGGGEPVVFAGRFMDVSVKTKEGWRYRADHASSSAPAGMDDPAAE